MSASLDHRKLYRFPWNTSDNPVGWLEPTSKCNLACDGCYRKNVNRHKTLEEVEADLDVFARYRTIDGVRIAGGEALLHPDIVEIVRRIAGRGWKPFIICNGQTLTPGLLHELRLAGLKDITFHVDSRQNRPGWKGKNEIELCELRQQFAGMVAREGGITCNFNATVFGDTIHHVPDIVDWARRNIDIVNAVIFMCYREGALDRFDYFAGGKKIDAQPLGYVKESRTERTDITAPEVVSRIRERQPGFMPCAYLNGTESPDSFKWLFATRIGNKRRIHGYMGPKGMELTTALYHWKRGRYMIHPPRKDMARGRGLMLLLSLFDPQVRRALWSWLKSPGDWLRRVHVQGVQFIQPIDIQPDGRQSMCDGCPDMTPYKGRLVWSCRLEECLHHGRFLHTAPKKADATGGRAVEPRVPAVAAELSPVVGAEPAGRQGREVR